MARLWTKGHCNGVNSQWKTAGPNLTELAVINVSRLVYREITISCREVGEVNRFSEFCRPEIVWLVCRRYALTSLNWLVCRSYVLASYTGSSLFLVLIESVERCFRIADPVLQNVSIRLAQKTVIWCEVKTWKVPMEFQVFSCWDYWKSSHQ